MRRHTPLLLACLLLALWPPHLHAADGGETTIMTDGTEQPGPNAQCDWSGLKKSLGYTESGGRYTITNPWNYLGKYQFGEARLHAIGWWSDPQIVDPGKCSGGSAKCEVKCGPVQKGYAACYNEFSGNWTGEAYSKYNITSYQAFLNNPEAQERAFDLHAALAYQETKPCHHAIGRTITDRKGRTCQVTLSGIIAGAHLAGAGSCSRGSGVCGYLCKGGGSADNATHVSDYICSHAGISVPMDPGQCSTGKQPTEVSPADPGDQPDTDPEFRGGGGDGVIIEHYDMINELIMS